MGQYSAGDGKTCCIAKDVRKEINYFAKGTANAYSGFYGSQNTCTGGTLLVYDVKVDHVVMYITEELYYRDQKFISREDDDGIIAQYNNVRLTCPAEDNHCVSGDVSYVWHVPLKVHCPLYHVRKFKEQMIQYDLPGLTIETHKVVLSTDNSHVRFVVKGTRTQCGQEFLTPNYPDLLTHLSRKFKKWSDFHETSYTLPNRRERTCMKFFLVSSVVSEIWCMFI